MSRPRVYVRALRIVLPIVVVLVAGTFVVACTRTSSKTNAGAPTPGGVGGGGSPSGCGSGLDEAGCACAAAATTQPCFNGDAAKRHATGCKDGVQTCQIVGEFLSWSACTGAVTNCSATSGCAPGEFGNACDMGPPPPTGTCADETKFCDGGVPTVYTDCCVAGSSRWCNTATPTWGKQLCGADGKWSTPCVEVADHPKLCTGCSAMLFDPACCVESGECCENYGNVITGTPATGCGESGNGGDASTSIGKCGGIICGL
jgi:hypothetical protein